MNAVGRQMNGGRLHPQTIHKKIDDGTRDGDETNGPSDGPHVQCAWERVQGLLEIGPNSVTLDNIRNPGPDPCQKRA